MSDLNQNHRASLLDNDQLLINNSRVQAEEESLSQDLTHVDTDGMVQGAVFIEDALYYKSIHHKTSPESLRLYRFYFSSPVQTCIQVVISLLLLVGFFESPSTLSYTSDPRRNPKRYELPFGFIEGIEIVGLLVLLASNIMQAFLITGASTPLLLWKRNRWLCIGFLVLLISFVDIAVSFALHGLPNITYKVTVRRLLRPYFMAQNTTMLKKTLKAMWNTMPEIVSVLTLLALHLYFFTMFGMLLFPKGGQYKNGTRVPGGELNSSESVEYFKDLGTGAMSLLVLLTTANNPDVMMPAYSEHRLYALFFILFSLIGTFLIFNLLTAIIYNQFRGYFEESMQSSYFRRCVAIFAALVSLVRRSTIDSKLAAAASDQLITSVPIDVVHEMVSNVHFTYEQREYVKGLLADIRASSSCDSSSSSSSGGGGGLASSSVSLNQEQFFKIFINMDCKSSPRLASVLSVPRWESKFLRTAQSIANSRYFDVVGNLVVLLNAILMTVEIDIHYEDDFHGVFSRLNIINYVFVVYYVIEQSFKIVAKGKKYFFDWRCLYEGVISLALLSIEMAQLVVYGGQTTSAISSDSALSLWDCARIINMLVLLRLLRIIPNFRPMSLVTSVLVGIIQSLKSFAGIIIIIYYFFAVLGMMLFRDAINPRRDPQFQPDVLDDGPVIPDVIEYECGTYEQLNYWANNFNDLGASLVTLWDIMVVNNWGVFLQAYKETVNSAAQLYFIVWWLISAVVCINLFVALILDNFIAKWENFVTSQQQQQDEEVHVRSTVQSLFEKKLRQPTHSEIVKELSKHPDLLPFVDVITSQRRSSHGNDESGSSSC